MRFLLELAWSDLRAGGRRLGVFVACLVLGVSLVAAAGMLHRLVAEALRADARQMFGGDVEVESRTPLPPEARAWMQARGALSRATELRTMLRHDDGRSTLVELQSVDEAYPLVGTVLLEPVLALSEALANREGTWGVAIDRALAARLQLVPGQRVHVGEIELEVRAVLARQPDRSLRADWGAAPVLLAEGALAATGLVQPLSRLEHRYRVRVQGAPGTWRDAFVAAFPQLPAEVRSVDERSDRVAEVLGQVGSGLLLIGFSALFIGGLGVFNSVQAWLQGRLASLATLRALGLRDARLAAYVLLQVLMMAALASAGGVLVGLGLALAAAAGVSARLPLDGAGASVLVAPALLAWVFGVLTALVFALPALARALTVSPAVLFRGVAGAALHTPRRARLATTALAALGLALLLAVLPEPGFGLAFVAAVVAVLLLLELVARALRRGAASAQHRAGLPLPLRLALAGLQQPASPLRTALLSLGSALTLLVACTLVVGALLRLLGETVPANTPALVFHDVQTAQIPLLHEALAPQPGAAPGQPAVRTAPLVLGRLVAVNGRVLGEDGDAARALESRDEHKLSDRSGNFDDVIVERGAWWPAGHRGAPLVAMEDREADQLGLEVGDRLRFEIQGRPLEARLVAIYAQRRLQSRLWLEAIFSDGALDPFVTRHVGAAWMPAAAALAAQDRLAALAPNIATARTESLLRETRSLLARASAALAVVAAVCLAASLLVLASVVAASRERQTYDATVMHVLGARRSLLGRVLLAEYTLLAVVTAGFAFVAGSALAAALVAWRLDIGPQALPHASGALTALAVSAASLGLGARWLLARLALQPAQLLRSGG